MYVLCPLFYGFEKNLILTDCYGAVVLSSIADWLRAGEVVPSVAVVVRSAEVTVGSIAESAEVMVQIC